MSKQNTKFYRRDEANAMKRLGLVPDRQSGGGWIRKADGENDDIICEYKTTEAASYRLTFEELNKLHEQAIQAGKIPVFAVSPLQSDKIYVTIELSDIQDVARYLKTGENPNAVYKTDVWSSGEVADTRKIEKKVIGAPSRKTQEALKYKRKENKAY